MVGGTIRQKLIYRESFRASVLQLTLETMRCQNHCTEILCLDNAFVLIEGHPKFRILTQSGRTGVVLDGGLEMIVWDVKGRPTRQHPTILTYAN
jgi:hypothetical protein